MLSKADRGNIKNIIKINYISAMKHPNVCNDIPSRIKRKLYCYNMVQPSNIKPIY